VTYSLELFVAEDGNDTTGDGSVGAPYATIGRALSGIDAGTRVNVEAGTYPSIGSFGGLTGTATDPIAIVGSGGVIVDANGAMGLGLQDAAYVVIEGLTIQNAVPHGFNIDDAGTFDTPAHHVVIRNVTFRDIGSGGNNDCLKLSGLDDFFVLGSSFSQCNQGEAIDMVGCHRGFISGNHFFDIIGNAVQTKGGSSDVTIHGNRFEDVAQRAVNAGGSTGLEYIRPQSATHEGARIQIVANTFRRTGSTPVAFVGCDACVFANNTIVDPTGYVVRILEENLERGPGADGFFGNNIVVFSSSLLNGYSWVNIGAGTLPETFTFANNLWFDLDGSSFDAPDIEGPITETASVIQQDPLFVDLASDDFHLEQGSPAQGAGTAVPRGVLADLDGALYPDPPDLGAFVAP
jgi:Right handed beta helix region